MLFSLPLPPPLNQIYRHVGNRVYKTTEARNWEQEAYYKIRSHWKKEPLETPVYFGISTFVNRDRDIDGSLKLTMDIFETAGVYKNDAQVEHLNVKKFKDKENPRLEVEVLPL